MEEKELYKSAVDSVKRYKKQGEELVDFDEYMDDIEKEYEEKRIFKAYSRLLLRDLKDLKEALKLKEYDVAEKIVNDLVEDTQKDIEE